jgi:hypothetical protein
MLNFWLSGARNNFGEQQFHPSDFSASPFSPGLLACTAELDERRESKGIPWHIEITRRELDLDT